MKTFRVSDLTARFGVAEHTILQWIRSGELRAINAARRPGTRPSWRISEEALAAFEAARSSQPEPPQKKRRKKATAGVQQFYPE